MKLRKNNVKPKTSNKSNPVCYNCGIPGHFSRECYSTRRNTGRNSRGNARRVSRRKYKRNSSSLYLGSNTVNSEAGLYVDLLINGTPAKFLIDTGATISLLADSLFEKSKSSCKPRIQQVTQDIVAANGQPLKVTGKGTFAIKIGDFYTPIEGIIANLSVEGILGLDFLITNGCTVDVKNVFLARGIQKMPLLLQGRLGVHRVAVKENISIAPQSEVVIQGEVIDNLPNIRASGLIEPVEEFLDKGKALVVKTVVTNDKIVPIRLEPKRKCPNTWSWHGSRESYRSNSY
jgi:hypothetical protein